MIYGYTRVSTGSQSEAAQVATLKKHRAGRVFREVAQGDKTDRAQLRRLLNQLAAGDVVMVTRLDRLARSTRDLLNTLATITEKNPRPYQRGPRPRQGTRRQAWPQTETDRTPEARGDPTPRPRRRAGARDRPQLQCQSQHDFPPCGFLAMKPAHEPPR
jgi:hypothetical protein